MSWDAGLWGEIRIEPARFKELEGAALDAREIDGLRPLSQEPLSVGSFGGILKALDEGKGEQLLELERKPRKGTLGVRAVLDEDSFRARLPALSQLFERAASLGAEGELTLFGLESDDDLAHELIIENGHARIRPLAKKGMLDKLRNKLGMKLAMRMPPLVQPVAADAPFAVHPDWARRSMFPRIEVSYRRDQKKTELAVDVQSDTANDGGPVIIALNAFELKVNAGIFGIEAHAKVKVRPAGARSKRTRAIVEVTDLDPIALRVLTEGIAKGFTNPFAIPRPGNVVSLTLSNSTDPEIDGARLSSWLADPTAFPRGLETLPIPIEDVPPPPKGALVSFVTDLAPADSQMLYPGYAVNDVLNHTPDPHGATRKGAVPPIFAMAHGHMRKGKKGVVELRYDDFSADRKLARGLFLAAIAKLNAKGPLVRGVTFALPG